jgi:hypothetical protein
MGFDEKSVFHVSSFINSPLFLVYLIFQVRVSLKLPSLLTSYAARLLQIACQEIFLDIWEVLLPSPTCMAHLLVWLESVIVLYL